MRYRLAAGLAAALFAAVALSASADEQRRGRGDGPAVGQPAPDFRLRTLADPAKEVRLSSFRGKRPVVLIFGSYT